MTGTTTLTLALALALGGLGSAAAAGEAQDRIFAVGLLDDVASGQRLVFDRERRGDFDAQALPPIEDAEIEVEVLADASGARSANVTLLEDGRSRSLDPMRADAGHPLLLIFLETVVRDVAALSGGSPFYIRNRMREALAEQGTIEPVEVPSDGTPVAGERVTFAPFTDDPNRDKLGALADLELRVTFADAVPGGFERFEAVAPSEAGGAPAFAETFVFARIEED